MLFRSQKKSSQSQGETCEQYWQRNGIVKSRVLSKYNSEQIVKPKLVNCSCCHNKVNGIKIHWNVGVANARYAEEEIPIWTPCEKCGKYLSHLEEENASKYLGMCIECFNENRGELI